MLAFFIGLLMTLYSALYKIIKKDIDNGTVLMLRGAIQVFQGFSTVSSSKNFKATLIPKTICFDCYRYQ